MRVIAALFGPYAPEALTAHVAVFSRDFKRFEPLTKLATSSCVGASRCWRATCGGDLRRAGLALGLGAGGACAGLRPRRRYRRAAAVAGARAGGGVAGEAG